MRAKPVTGGGAQCSDYAEAHHAVILVDGLAIVCEEDRVEVPSAIVPIAGLLSETVRRSPVGRAPRRPTVAYLRLIHCLLSPGS